MNKPQNKSAQTTTEQAQPHKFSIPSDTKPDFSHRLNSYHEGSYCLEDAAFYAIEQAHSIINHVQQQFTGESPKLNDDLNFYALESARNSILDAKAIIEHYLRGHKATQGGAIASTLENHQA